MTRSRFRVLKGVIPALVVVAGVGYFAFRHSHSDDPVTFKVGKIDRGSIEQVVTATGQLNAVVTVQVGSQVSGTLQSLGADFNTQVKEGQIVAQIEPTRFKAALEQAQAALKSAEASAARAKVNYDSAKREFDRGSALATQKVIGSQELDDLRSKFDLARVDVASTEGQVAQAKASVGVARVDLEHTTIRSPISGTVLQRAVDVGQTVAASLSAPTLFTIAQDLAKMEVRAAIDESDVGKLKEGLEARFTVDAYPGREFVATIFQVRSNPTVTQNVVTYDAILRVDNADGKLRPGMTASVRVVTEKRENVLRVPNAALRFKAPADMVLAQTGTPGAGGMGRNGGGDGGVAAGGPTDEQRKRWAERAAAGGPGGAEGGGPGAGGGRRGGGGPGGGRRGGGDPRIAARVYKLQGEKLAAVPFRPGISDEQYTEVLRGPINEGDEVVTEATGPGIQQAAPRPATPPGGMGGGGRNRGPRFF